jgi:hypothetical protein
MERCSIYKFEGELKEFNRRYEIGECDDGYTYNYLTYICPKCDFEIYVYTLTD